jgi:predicted RNase H-like HicB family nuclease
MKGLQVKIERDGDEFHAWCPELPGCHSHGKTISLAARHLKEAMTLYIEDIFEESKVEAKQRYLVS